MHFKNISVLSAGTSSNNVSPVICLENLTSRMREFIAVDQKVLHRKRVITAYTKWLISSFE